MTLLLTLLITATVSAACIGAHWLVMEHLIKRLCGRSPNRPRVLLQGMVILLLAHLAQITAFAGVYLLVDHQWPQSFGNLAGEQGGPRSIGFLDAWYFSACTYTTVGYGDLRPRGDLRLLAGVEALVGFLMITWSASFSFYIMNRAWRDRFRD